KRIKAMRVRAESGGGARRRHHVAAQRGDRARVAMPAAPRIAEPYVIVGNAADRRLVDIVASDMALAPLIDCRPARAVESPHCGIRIIAAVAADREREERPGRRYPQAMIVLRPIRAIAARELYVREAVPTIDVGALHEIRRAVALSREIVDDVGAAGQRPR